MARYIDADALLENLKKQYGEELGWQCTVNMSDVGMMIEDAPTADVVPKSELSIVGVQNMALVNTKEDLQRRLVAVESVASAAIEKASDMVIEAKREVALEVIEAASEFVRICAEEAKKLADNEEYDLAKSEFRGNQIGALIILNFLAKLKKKYTEGETNGNGINKTI
jgi:hypothetical protein